MLAKLLSAKEMGSAIIIDKKYFFEGFKTIIFYSVHSIRFVKYVFSVKIWFVKTSTRIVKYEP